MMVTSQDPSVSERSPAQEEVDRQDVHRSKVTLLPIGGPGARKISWTRCGLRGQVDLSMTRIFSSLSLPLHDSRRRGHDARVLVLHVLAGGVACCVMVDGDIGNLDRWWYDELVS